VVPPPVITSFTPAEAVPGAKVVITGKNLEKATYVYFPGSYATIKPDSGTTIVTSVPEYASTGPIYVGTAVSTAFSSTSFTVDPPLAPVITSISPTCGAAGQVLTITGTGLEFAAASGGARTGGPHPAWKLARQFTEAASRAASCHGSARIYWSWVSILVGGHAGSVDCIASRVS
jgi:hypothetical protein